MPNPPHISDTEYVAALLLYIRTGAEIRPFLKATNNDLQRLNRVVGSLLKSGYIVQEGNVLRLTESGKGYLRGLNKSLRRRGLYAYLLPDYTVKRTPMMASEVYITKFLDSGGYGRFSSSYICPCAVPEGRSDESSGDEESTFERDKWKFKIR